MTRSALAKLRRLQKGSLALLLIRAGQMADDRCKMLLQNETEGLGLRRAHMRLLPHLQAPGGIRITDLAARLGVSKQAVQPLVSEMEASGAVYTEPDSDDVRARLVFLTESGVEIMLREAATLHEIDAELRQVLGKTDVDSLKVLLGRVQAAIEPREREHQR
jgi:DNA-binding MarR family transcriptional regulator